ncbi:hypothetical protein [Rheinheimera soli]|uniref:Uncharacterized protein n=1 Tax=Rheinheimera soli TaxID=443616 RepID=A0ABU1VYZ7_9GAMM|nr:hypothetical protein [Rheinheimera soli]MDR7120939.1 hypothetical protein [Rheinheimera soli]
MSKERSSVEFKIFLIGTILVLALGIYSIWSSIPVSGSEKVESLSHVPIWEMPWFMNLIKLVVTCLVLQVYFLAIARPALKAILHGSKDDAQ